MKISIEKIISLAFCLSVVVATYGQSTAEYEAKLASVRQALEQNGENQACVAGKLSYLNEKKLNSHLVWSGIGGDEDVSYKQKVDEIQTQINRYAKEKEQLKQEQKTLEEQLKTVVQQQAQSTGKK